MRECNKHEEYDGDCEQCVETMWAGAVKNRFEQHLKQEQLYRDVEELKREVAELRRRYGGHRHHIGGHQGNSGPPIERNY